MNQVQVLDKLNLYKQLKQFILENNTVGTIAGVCIGAASKDFIQSLVGNVVLPNLNSLMLHIPYKPFVKLLPHHLPASYSTFCTQFITWLLVLISTMLFIKLAFNAILGIKKTTQTTQPSRNTRNGTLATIADDSSDNFKQT